MNIKTIVVGTLAVIIAIAAIQNMETSYFDFLFWRFQISKLFLVLISCLFGIAIGFFIKFKIAK
jgi:uncharacterized integral membrane protein